MKPHRGPQEDGAERVQVSIIEDDHGSHNPVAYLASDAKHVAGLTRSPARRPPRLSWYRRPASLTDSRRASTLQRREQYR